LTNEALNINIYNIIIICGSIQGLLFGFAVLFSEKYKSSSNFYLAQVILFLSLNNLFYWFADTRLGFRYQYFYNLYIPWILLVLPYYYFFVSYFLGKKVSFQKKAILKLPFVISLIIHAVLSIDAVLLGNLLETPNAFTKVFYIGEEYVAALFTFGVIYKVFRLLKKYEKQPSVYSLHTLRTKTGWLRKILYLGILICSIWLILVFYNHINAQNFFSNDGKYFLWGTTSILIYWMGYLGIYHNGIFRQRKIIRDTILSEIKDTSTSLKSKLSSSKFEEIDSYIKNEKLFLDPNLSLASLEDDLKLSEGYISQLINNFSGGNFSSYINNLRIEQSKRFLQNNEYEKYTIVSIALESGFNSKSAFYLAFKKATGISPTEYKKKSLS
jgi:AraC-like DNA-binding protein